MRKTLLAAMLVLVAATSAMAQTQDRVVPRTSGVDTSTHTITYKERTQYEFDADEVEGSVLQPDVDLITGRLKANHQSLVRPRSSFQPELLQSVDSL
jgi:hypothetical protein